MYMFISYMQQITFGCSICVCVCVCATQCKEPKLEMQTIQHVNETDNQKDVTKNFKPHLSAHT